MDRIRLKDKTFELFITDSEIQKAAAVMAHQIKQDVGDKNPLFVAILNGAFMFASDLMSALDDAYQITFARYSSYKGLDSTGEIHEIMPVQEDLTGRTVILIEDVIDTGFTMDLVIKKFKSQGAVDVRLATMLFKPEALKCKITPDYVGLPIPIEFIVGHGLDYDGLGRAYKDIYKIVES
jgi:hypoxanthine phosphoribosyltransferase